MGTQQEPDGQQLTHHQAACSSFDNQAALNCTLTEFCHSSQNQSMQHPMLQFEDPILPTAKFGNMGSLAFLKANAYGCFKHSNNDTGHNHAAT
jgi:hypothetical protein